jgi:hypothetical protein
MHFIQTPWLAVQCSGKFFDKKLRVPPRLTLGLGNEYFCRPQPSKRQKRGMAQEGTKMPRTVNFFLPPNCYRPIDVKKLDGQRKGQGFKLKIDLAVLTIIL